MYLETLRDYIENIECSEENIKDSDLELISEKTDGKTKWFLVKYKTNGSLYFIMEGMDKIIAAKASKEIIDQINNL